MGFFDSESTTTQEVPEDAKQFRKDLFANTKQVINRDFPTYDPQDKVAPFSQDQQASFDMARNSIGSTQPAMNSAINATAARQDPNTQAQTISQPSPVSAAQVDAGQYGNNTAETVDTGQYGDVTAREVEARTFPDADVDEYMNPYIDEVIDQTADEMQRELQIAQNQQMQDFAARGAFGGARQAIAQSENIRNFADKIGQEIAGLRDRGFQQARQQISTDQDRQLQADRYNQAATNQMRRFNEQIGLEADTFNAQAQNRMSRFNDEIGLQADTFNAQAQNRMGRFNNKQAMEAALANQQATNNMRQFRDRLGLAASDQLASLAEAEQARQQQDIQFLNEIGRQQQQQNQRLRDAAYQEFQRRVQWPERQLGLQSDVLSGAPIGQRQTTTNEPSGASLIGAGAAGLGALGDFGSTVGLF